MLAKAVKGGNMREIGLVIGSEDAGVWGASSSPARVPRGRGGFGSTARPTRAGGLRGRAAEAGETRGRWNKGPLEQGDSEE